MEAEPTRVDFITKEKQGQAIFLSLPENMWECVRHLSIADIKNNHEQIGRNIFTRPEYKRIYCFQGILLLQKKFRRKYDFLVRYEFLYQKLEKFGIT